MAATTAADVQVIQKLIGGYAGMYLPEKLSLVASGVARAQGGTLPDGNTFIKRGFKPYTGLGTVPVAGTDATIRALGTYNQVGVIARRGDVYGLEDVAGLAGGITSQEFQMQAGANIAHNAGLTIETEIFTYQLPAIFGSTGTLYSTHTVDNSGSAFDYFMLEQAKAKMGESAGLFDTLIIHPDQFYGKKIQALTSAPEWELLSQYNQTGVTYAGTLAGLRVILNERVYNSAGVYHSYVCAAGAIDLEYQEQLHVEIARLPLKAMGTDVLVWRVAYSPTVGKVSFAGTAPTGVAGASTSDLGTVGNWSLVTGAHKSQTPMVAIISAVGSV